MWSNYWIKDSFLLTHKKRLTIILTWVFSGMCRVWGSPGCCDFDHLKVFHVTKHHVGPLCWLFDPLFFRGAAFCGEQKQEHLYLRHNASSQNTLRWPWFCVSLRMCTGPAFRWRHSAIVLDLSKCFFPPPCFCKNSYFANQ